MNYKIPNPNRIDEMCDAFEDYMADHPCVKNVDMMDTRIKEEALDQNYCGTPGCHAGLFALLFESDETSFIVDRYFSGAEMMAQFLLGNSSQSTAFDLEIWAGESGHWPNHSGTGIFACASAFGVNNPTLTDYVPIKDIVKTWRKAAKNIRKDKKK